ncbi:4-hydroxy-2-oxoheptanedioate aldolase [Ascochyta rabiei]|nr:4-hydroxy-2-oxoheptanedioate aldolase [Ascochyta rabiei]UPX10773.1 4-hydroxy-2-oxoheptanedioate aldolase [Ascochyta rabiei]
MNTLQEASTIYKSFKRGGPAFGGWQMLPGTNHSRAIARSGVDWVCVDCEHGNIDDGEMHEAVIAIAREGVSPIVRIPANEAWMVKRALDAGAHGIVVPLIYTVDDAKRLVASAKFPPEGHRGFGSPFSPHAFTGEALTEYLQNANSSIQTIVQIETKSALESVKEIAAIPGVDCLLIGPFDLGNNIGRPILGEMHQELKDAIELIKEAAHSEGKKVGIYCADGQQAQGYAQRGFDFISVCTDFPAITAAFAGAVKTAKGEATGDDNGRVKGYDGR